MPDGRCRSRSSIDPFETLAGLCRPWGRLDPSPALPFVGGWIGYLAYEAGRWVEPSAGWPPRPDRLPIAHWALFDTVLIHDHEDERWIIAGVDLPPSDTQHRRPPVAKRLDALERFVSKRVFEKPFQSRDRQEAVRVRPRKPLPHGRGSDQRGHWNYSSEDYLAKVNRALAYVRAGDIFQVNLARRFCVDVPFGPEALYQRLCDANPAAYAAYLPIPTRGGRGPQAIVSSSPELFLSLRQGRVTTCPIKGTRPRVGDPALDAAARDALAISAKDRAELNMIIDLERNDLGRVCEFGSVRVVHDGRIEAHPTVFHRAATILGHLREDADAIGLLRATFPGGSVTGAPKVRAMQIINELEPHPRGPYCGAIGYITLDGEMQLNLAIRTMTLAQGAPLVAPPSRRCRHRRDACATGATGLFGRVHMHVGSAIVADSDPEEELAELQAKAAGMLSALGAGDEAGAPLALAAGESAR